MRPPDSVPLISFLPPPPSSLRPFSSRRYFRGRESYFGILQHHNNTLDTQSTYYFREHQQYYTILGVYC